MLQPAQNTIVHLTRPLRHGARARAAAGGVEDVESFDSDREFVVVLCRCMCSFLRVKSEQLSLQPCLQPMVTGTRVCPSCPRCLRVFLPEQERCTCTCITRRVTRPAPPVFLNLVHVVSGERGGTATKLNDWYVV